MRRKLWLNSESIRWQRQRGWIELALLDNGAGIAGITAPDSKTPAEIEVIGEQNMRHEHE